MQDQKDIIEEIARHLGVTSADIDPEASLRDDLGLGPIEISDLITDLSTKFSVNFDPAETEGLDTINDIVVMVEDLMIE